MTALAAASNTKKVPHVTLKSIANDEPPGEETLYDQPLVDNSRLGFLVRLLLRLCLRLM